MYASLCYLSPFIPPFFLSLLLLSLSLPLLFSSLISLSREDERMSTGEGAGLSGEGAGLDDLSGERGGQEDVEEEVPRINVEIPRCVANLGSDIHFVKLPNFLSVETR